MGYTVHGSLGQNTGVGSLSLLQGIFSTQGSNPGLLLCGWILYKVSHKGSPRVQEWVVFPFSRISSRPRNRTGVSCIAGGFFTNWTIRVYLVSNSSLFKFFFQLDCYRILTRVPCAGKDWTEFPDAGKDWRLKEKWAVEDEMVGWHHWLSGHESEQTQGAGDGQGVLVCCNPWGHKELDMTERQNWIEFCSSFPYFLQFKSSFCNKKFMIWATVTSQSYFCYCIQFLHLCLQRIKSIWFQYWLSGDAHV